MGGFLLSGLQIKPARGGAIRLSVPCAVIGKKRSRRVVKNHAQPKAFAASDPADPMAQIDAIGSPRPLHGALTHSEDHAALNVDGRRNVM